MRRRRLATLVVAMVLALGGLVGIGGTPAAADPPGGTLRGVYYDGEHCNDYGNEGVQTGRWSWYYCEYHPGGMYFLWSFTY